MAVGRADIIYRSEQSDCLLPVGVYLKTQMVRGARLPYRTRQVRQTGVLHHCTCVDIQLQELI